MIAYFFYFNIYKHRIAQLYNNIQYLDFIMINQKKIAKSILLGAFLMMFTITCIDISIVEEDKRNDEVKQVQLSDGSTLSIENLKGGIRIDVESTNYTYPLGTRNALFIIKAGANFTNSQKSTQGHISVEVSSIDGCKDQRGGIVTNLSMVRYVSSQSCRLGDDPLVADTSFRVYAQAWMDSGESTYGYGQIKIKIQKTSESELETEKISQIAEAPKEDLFKKQKKMNKLTKKLSNLTNKLNNEQKRILKIKRNIQKITKQIEQIY